MDLTSVPGELTGPLATVAAILALWKIAGEGIKTWRDGRQVGKAQPPAYEALSERVLRLEERTETLERSVRRLAGVLTREVASVLHWIAGGARPPTPDDEIALIRSVIADLERTTPESKED